MDLKETEKTDIDHYTFSDETIPKKNGISKSQLAGIVLLLSGVFSLFFWAAMWALPASARSQKWPTTMDAR